MKKYLYLCGAITGLSYEEARYGWRKQVVEALAGSEIVPVSPMRWKTHLENVADRDSLSPLGDPESVLSCSRGLTTRDRFDVKRSHLLFANLLGMDRVSIGSMIEFGWADAWRIPILAIMEHGNRHEHAMVHELIGWRCHTLEEGITVARAVLTEGI